MTPYMKCMICKHYIKWDRINGEIIEYCKAFPEAIPQEIIDFNFDHTAPYQGDNGIQFEPKDTEKKD